MGVRHNVTVSHGPATRYTWRLRLGLLLIRLGARVAGYGFTDDPWHPHV